ncbi:hypothetical protein NDU88_002331 [Pleurodeles waltl]|uniref:Uncharacterized protein n=1 Tax=Pleurodeles waltl TaxID=8319 RepID=A0AAV7Q9K6_PLEWA|nr:hypothetical protein NDU88_002331 [Pleurodeles waltl]
MWTLPLSSAWVGFGRAPGRADALAQLPSAAEVSQSTEYECSRRSAGLNRLLPLIHSWVRGGSGPGQPSLRRGTSGPRFACSTCYATPSAHSSQGRVMRHIRGSQKGVCVIRNAPQLAKTKMGKKCGGGEAWVTY